MVDEELLLVQLEATYKDPYRPEVESFTLFQFLDFGPEFAVTRETMNGNAHLPDVKFKITYLPVPENIPKANHYGNGIVQ